MHMYISHAKAKYMQLVHIFHVSKQKCVQFVFICVVFLKLYLYQNKWEYFQC